MKKITIETEFFMLESPITGEPWQVYPEELNIPASLVEGASDEEFANIVHHFVGREELVNFFRGIEGYKSEELVPWDEYPDMGDARADMHWMDEASLEDEYEFDEIDHGSAFLNSVDEED